ncbi:hypothetical protein ABTE19_20620, partial [Acinetobacter baumannii]
EERRMKPFKLKQEKRPRQPLLVLDSRTTLAKPKPPLKFMAHFPDPYPEVMMYLTYDGRRASTDCEAANWPNTTSDH